MSRIDELIAELAPNGVDFRSLGSLGKRNKGTPITASKMKTLGLTPGPIRVFAGGQTVADVSDDAVPKKDVVLVPSIIVKSRGNIGFAYYDRPFTHKSELWSYSITDPDVEQRFVYYFLLTQVRKLQLLARATSVKLPQLGVKDTDTLRIPVPPLQVQREIVRILDQFSQLEAELEAELEARRRQHAFYWESLLSPRESWRATTVGEVAQVFDGPHATPKKTQSGPWYLSISSLKNGRFDLTESAHLDNDEFPRWTRRVAPRLGDTMFSYETRLGQAAFWDTDQPAALGRRMGLLRPNESVINPRFLTLVYLGPQFQALIRAKTVSGSTVDRIPIADLASWPLIIPPIKEQVKIVAALDSFDALVNDLSVGLPAELAARRKQHEYYRDRLLTFEETMV